MSRTHLEVDVHAALIAAAESAEAASEGLPPVAVGLIAFFSLLSLLAVTYAFRNVGSRH